jgi:glycosyltransferase 2 family protein
MRRRLIRFLVPLSLLLAVVLAAPTLGQVRRQLGAIDLWWVAAAVGFEVASCASFVVVFRAFFHRVPASLSRRIAWVEMGSGALLPGGGVTSYVLGGLLLNEAGMERRNIVVRSGGVFWITSAVNAGALALGAVLLETGIGNGPRDFARVLLPVIIAAPITVVIALSPVIARRRTTPASPRWLGSLVDGVADAWRAARHPTWRLAGALGYLAFDMAVLACVFRGLGYHATAGALMLAYLIGYCATMIPVPAGIGVLEGGLAGALVLYGAPPATTAAAVLVYHAIAFWIPSLGGLGAYSALLSRSESNRSDHASTSSTPPDSARRSRRRLSCPVGPADALRPAGQRQS